MIQQVCNSHFSVKSIFTKIRKSDQEMKMTISNFLGCLMSCAWRDERCRIGLILGTGTNACYLEEIKDIHTIDQNAYNDKNGHMVINTEWV